MGATAARLLAGTPQRGGAGNTRAGPVFLTVHPRHILRLPDPAQPEPRGPAPTWSPCAA